MKKMSKPALTIETRKNFLYELVERERGEILKQLPQDYKLSDDFVAKYPFVLATSLEEFITWCQLNGGKLIKDDVPLTECQILPGVEKLDAKDVCCWCMNYNICGCGRHISNVTTKFCRLHGQNVKPFRDVYDDVMKYTDKRFKAKTPYSSPTLTPLTPPDGYPSPSPTPSFVTIYE